MERKFLSRWSQRNQVWNVAPASSRQRAIKVASVSDTQSLTDKWHSPPRKSLGYILQFREFNRSTSRNLIQFDEAFCESNLGRHVTWQSCQKLAVIGIQAG